MAINFFNKNKSSQSDANTNPSDDSVDQGIKLTKESFFKKLSRVIIGRTTIDNDILDELEEILLTSDVGVETTVKVIKRIEKRVSQNKYLNVSELNGLLRDEIIALLEDNKADANSDDFFTSELPAKPYVILVVGINGVGKTTTIGKLAYRFKQSGKKVLLGAGDTFRAAAVEQLSAWAERAQVDIVKQDMGSDPAAVAYDAVNSAVSKGYDVVIVDTAGRLHNKTHLMNELAKIKRSVQKIVPDGPHETLLVLDASTGQNAFEQAKQFTSIADINALALTKLDGTAKGGVVIGVSDQYKVPVKYIGIGEGIQHLKIFNRKEFVESLFRK